MVAKPRVPFKKLKSFRPGCDDDIELEDALNEDRELGSDEYPIEDFDMDNINDREIGDFFDDQNNVDFRREGQIMKG